MNPKTRQGRYFNDRFSHGATFLICEFCIYCGIKPTSPHFILNQPNAMASYGRSPLLSSPSKQARSRRRGCALPSRFPGMHYCLIKTQSKTCTYAHVMRSCVALRMSCYHDSHHGNAWLVLADLVFFFFFLEPRTHLELVSWPAWAEEKD
jgi:hypothetical protein